MKGIITYRKKQKEETIKKVEIAILELQFNSKSINFNSISKQSGVSKSFIYGDEDLKERIEELRQQVVSKEINKRAKYDKTSKSKDVVIEAKERQIVKLEVENKKLKSEVEHLRSLLYNSK